MVKRIFTSERRGGSFFVLAFQGRENFLLSLGLTGKLTAFPCRCDTPREGRVQKERAPSAKSVVRPTSEVLGRAGLANGIAEIRRGNLPEFIFRRPDAIVRLPNLISALRNGISPLPDIIFRLPDAFSRLPVRMRQLPKANFTSISTGVRGYGQQ